ncbi:MAG TPA: VTT domain-containing protein [Paenibacillus sp.]|jgi:membrane protein DedA with SNARE-associated domain
MQGLPSFEGKPNWLLCIVAAGTGTSLGITFSYWIGYRLGTPFFEKYGYKVLIIAYFIPGVRHIMGCFSGTTQLSFRKYAIFAYIGAFLYDPTNIKFKLEIS